MKTKLNLTILALSAMFLSSCDEVDEVYADYFWGLDQEAYRFYGNLESPEGTALQTAFIQTNLRQLSSGGFISTIHQYNYSYNFQAGQTELDSNYIGMLYIDSIAVGTTLPLDENSESFFAGVENASSRNQDQAYLNLEEISVLGLNYDMHIVATDPTLNHVYSISNSEILPAVLVTGQRPWHVFPSNGNYASTAGSTVRKKFYSHVDSSFTSISLGTFTTAEDSIIISFPEKIQPGTYEMFSIIPGEELPTANITLLDNNYNTSTLGAQVIINGVNEIDGLVQGRIVGSFTGGTNTIDLDINFKATLNSK